MIQLVSMLHLRCFGVSEVNVSVSGVTIDTPHHTNTGSMVSAALLLRC